jgi:AcrR family transcriptional regulator
MAGQERRETIVEAAISLFSQRGFRGTTTRELAAAVGVSEPVLYQHFQTKRDLYTAIIDYKFQSGLGGFGKRLDEAQQLNDDRAFFGTLARIIVQWFNEDPAYVRLLLYSALEGHELAALCYESTAVYVHEKVASYLRSRIEQGAVRADLDPLVAGRSFISTLVHFAQTGVLHGCAIQGDPEQFVDTAVEIFVRGIAKTEEK